MSQAALCSEGHLLEASSQTLKPTISSQQDILDGRARGSAMHLKFSGMKSHRFRDLRAPFLEYLERTAPDIRGACAPFPS